MYYFITLIFVFILRNSSQGIGIPLSNWIRCFIVPGINQTDYPVAQIAYCFFSLCKIVSNVNVLCLMPMLIWMGPRFAFGALRRMLEFLTLHLCSIQIWEIGYNTKKCAENQTGARTLDEGSRGEVNMFEWYTCSWNIWP